MKTANIQPAGGKFSHKTHCSMCSYRYSCRSCCILHLLGAIPRTTAGLHLRRRQGPPAQRSISAEVVRDYHLHLRHTVLPVHLHQPTALQHHEQQISSSFQGTSLNTCITPKLNSPIVFFRCICCHHELWTSSSCLGHCFPTIFFAVFLLIAYLVLVYFLITFSLTKFLLIMVYVIGAARFFFSNV